MMHHCRLFSSEFHILYFTSPPPFCQLGRSVHKEAFEEQDHDGITPEVLDYIVREASLREMGRSEQADDVKKEALRARLVF